MSVNKLVTFPNKIKTGFTRNYTSFHAWQSFQRWMLELCQQLVTVEACKKDFIWWAYNQWTVFACCCCNSTFSQIKLKTDENDHFLKVASDTLSCFVDMFLTFFWKQQLISVSLTFCCNSKINYKTIDITVQNIICFQTQK